MQSYIAQLVFGIYCDGAFTEQYDQQVRLINAPHTDAAYEVAQALGNSLSETFLDRNGRKMDWSFLSVLEVMPIELESGSLLYSFINEQKPIGLEN